MVEDLLTAVDAESWHKIKAEYQIMLSPILQIEFSLSILDCDIARLTEMCSGVTMPREPRLRRGAPSQGGAKSW